MGLVLGLQGPAKAGKDTVADYLVDYCGWHEKLSFAHNLKEMCKGIFYLTEADVNSQEGKERIFKTPKTFTQRNLASVFYWMSSTHSSYPIRKGVREYVSDLVGTSLVSPRHVLQFVGTEICRAVIPTYHLDIISEKVFKNKDKNYVISDARFPNEGDLILDSLGGKVIKVVRDHPAEENINRLHLSETSMEGWDRFSDTIDNRKDGLKFLFSEVNNLLERQNIWQKETESSLEPQKETSSLMEATDALSATGTIRITNSIDVG